jgi:MscS family membrane protein
MEAVRNVLNSMFFGNSIWQYLLFFGCILVGILLGRIAYHILKNTLLKIAEKSKMDIFVYLVEIIRSPIIVLLFTLGFIIGKQFLTLNEGARQFFNNIQLVLIQIIIFWFILRLIDMLILRYLKPMAEKTETKLDEHLLLILQKSVKFILITLAFIIILSNMGYDILSLLATLGIGGLAIALAAQDAVKNLIAGFILLMDKPFKINDWIEVNEVTGGVFDIGLRSTKLTSEKNTTVIIPNSIILDSVVKNYTANNITRQIQSVGISPFTPIDQVEKTVQIIRETVASVDGTDREDISVRFVNFGESSLDLEVAYGLADPVNWRMVIHNVNMGIKGNLDKIGVELAVPIEREYPGKIKTI